jgi:PAS domain S-box-containing protein
MKQDVHKADLIDMGILFEDAPTAQMVFEPDLTVVAANRLYCRMLGIAREDLVGKRVFEAFPANPDDPGADAEAELQASADTVVATGRAHEMPVRQHDVRDADGRYAVRYWRVVNSPVFADPGDPGRVTHVIHTAEDITRVILGDQLQEAKRRASMRGADLAYFECHPDAGTLLRSPQLDAMFGVAPDEPSDAIEAFLDRIHPEDRPDVEADMYRVARTVGAYLQQDYRVVLPDGGTRWLTAQGESIRAPNTQGVLIVGVLLDVSHIKESEVRLRAALADRDLLIGEVNHRVKNSLQLVGSILSLEANSARTEEAKDKLAAARDRIDAVAVIHAALYQGEDVRRVAFGDYLERLCDYLATSLGADRRGVSIEVDADAILIETNNAITLSLVVNELVANAFKHAFPEDAGGTVSVCLRRDDPATVTLTVADDGTGSDRWPLEDDALITGLGTRLITGSVRQLEGSMHTEGSNGGWTTTITFPVAERADPAG